MGHRFTPMLQTALMLIWTLAFVSPALATLSRPTRATANGTHYKDQPVRTRRPRPPRQRFRQTPEPVVSLTEGETILLRCEVDHQSGDTQWVKDGLPVFYANRTRASNVSSERRNIVGSVEKGEHNLELVNARVEDSGAYECQVQPTTDESNDQLRAFVQVIVRPQPAPQREVQQRVPSSHKLVLLTKLPRSVAGAASSAQILSHQLHHQHHHHHQQQQQQQQLPQQSDQSTSLTIGWLFVLLAFDGILLLADIYLIYSLCGRCQKNKRANSRKEFSCSSVDV